eukprot:4935038-Pyramimonas_sp.AAC.1
MGPLPYIVTAEIFPTRVRSAGVAASSAANWAANFLVSVTFLPLLGLVSARRAPKRLTKRLTKHLNT